MVNVKLYVTSLRLYSGFKMKISFEKYERQALFHKNSVLKSQGYSLHIVHTASRCNFSTQLMVNRATNILRENNLVNLLNKCYYTIQGRQKKFCLKTRAEQLGL